MSALPAGRPEGPLRYEIRLRGSLNAPVGLIGAPLLLAADTAIFFGVLDRGAAVAAIAAAPVALWEFSLGVYLTVKGFRPSAVAALPAAGSLR
jgi:hypothetical protein